MTGPNELAIANRVLVQRARDFLTAIATADVPRMQDCMAENVRWHYPPSAADAGYPLTANGRQEVAELLARSRNRHYRELTPEVIHVAVDGDLVAVLANMRGVTVRGKDYENRYAFHLRFDACEAVAEAWEVVDTAYALKLFSL